MAFPAIGDYNGGVCPSSHPVAIFSVFLEFFYDTAAVQDFNRWVYAMGDRKPSRKLLPSTPFKRLLTL